VNLRRSLLATVKGVVARVRTPLTGVYSTHAEAVLACRSDSYESKDLVTEVARKTSTLIDEVYAVAAPAVAHSQLLLAAGLGLATGAGKQLSVVDFGGACGAHALIARRILGGSTDLCWHIVETPAMVHAALQLELPKWVRFHDNLRSALNAAGNPDLIYANNSLQYCPDPIDVAAAIVAARPGVLCLGRLAHCEANRPIFTVQQSRLIHNGPGEDSVYGADRKVRYPMSLRMLSDFRAIYTEQYRELLRADDAEMLMLPGAGSVRYTNLLLGRR
jgi:putative methyltransferase (TIGR04325 family)